MSTTTPGPWIVRRSPPGPVRGKGYEVDIETPRGTFVLRLMWGDGFTDEEMLANMRAMAATSALLEAARDFYLGRKEARECEQAIGQVLRDVEVPL